MCELEPMLAESIAGTSAPGRGDIRPLLIAASMTAAFMSDARPVLGCGSQGGEPMTHEQGMAILDEVLEFLRGGLEAMQHD